MNCPTNPTVSILKEKETDSTITDLRNCAIGKISKNLPHYWLTNKQPVRGNVAIRGNLPPA